MHKREIGQEVVVKVEITEERKRKGKKVERERNAEIRCDQNSQWKEEKVGLEVQWKFRQTDRETSRQAGLGRPNNTVAMSTARLIDYYSGVLFLGSSIISRS